MKPLPTAGLRADELEATLIRRLQPQPLRGIADLRALRTRVRLAASGLGITRRQQYEFICACTAVARNLLRQPGESSVTLDILRHRTHWLLRASFEERLLPSSDPEPGDLVESLLSGLPLRFPDITQLVDQIDIGRIEDRRVRACLVKWI